MKKLLASILLVCYVAFSCGVVINFHFCMGKLNSVKLFASNSDQCKNCGMTMANSHKCCGDETRIIKLNDDQQIAQAVHSLQTPDAIITTPSDYIVTSFYNTDKSFYHCDHSPPLLSAQDSFLQNCVFRI